MGIETAYFVQRVDKGWEEVDQFIYENWKGVVDEQEVPRYNGNRFIRIGGNRGEVKLDLLESISADALGMIVRLVGAHVPTHSVPGGFAPKPKELLRVRPARSKGFVYYNVLLGQKFRAVA